MDEVLPINSFAGRIKIMIKRVGNKEKLAKATGISATMIGKYAEGISEPARDKLVDLAKAADVGVLWLVTGEGVMKGSEPSKPPAPVTNEAQKEVEAYLRNGQQPSSYAWFHEWIEEQLKGKNISEVMNIAVKFKTVLDENDRE